MEFLENAEITTSDFWYDVFEGGYIKPEKLLKSSDDIAKVKEAIAVLEKFYNSAEELDIINFL